MSNKTIINDILELRTLLENDFDDYQDVLDQIIGDIVKSSNLTQSFISFTNEQLSNSPTRKKGLRILLKLLKLCPADFIEENAISWLNNSLKNCQYDSSITSDAFKIISLLLTFCQDIPELNKSVTSGILSKILELISKINHNNSNRVLSSLACLETCLRIYPGFCAPFKPTIDTFLLSFIDSSNPNIVNQVGRCLHIFQQIGSSGVKGVNYTSAWKNQQLTLCATINSLMDDIFESIMEMGEIEYDKNSALNLPKTSSGDEIKIKSNRLINVVVFMQQMLLGAYPAPKTVAPDLIIQIVQRGLSITNSSLGDHVLSDTIHLSSNLFFIHKSLLHLLQALMICLGRNLIPYASAVSKLILNNLKQTKGKNASNVQAFCELRLTCYETLSLWNTIAKSCSNIHLFAETLIPIIINDCSPISTGINLTIQNKAPKHMSKKARKKMQQEKITQSSFAKTYSPISKKSSNNRSNIYHSRICKKSLDCLNDILIHSGYYLKVSVHKQLQEFVIKMLLNIHQGVSTTPYDECACKISLYKTLTTLVTNHHWNFSPPIEYAISLLSKGQFDVNPEVSFYCSTAIANLNSFIHPSCGSLQFPINVENLKKDLNETTQKEGINQNGEESDEAVNESMDIYGFELLDDDITEIETNISETHTSNTPEDLQILENKNTDVELVENKTVENGRIEIEVEEDLKSDEESAKSKKAIEISDEEIIAILDDKMEENDDVIIEDKRQSPEKEKIDDKVIDLEEDNMLTSFVNIIN